MSTSDIEVGGNLKGLTNFEKVAGILTEVFPNAAYGLSDFIGALKKGASGAELAKTAISGLWGIISAHPIGAAIGIVAGLALAFNKMQHAAEDANESMRDSFSDYENSKSDLEDINNQIQETQNSINELEAKGSLTFIEKSQLEDLKQASAQLELQADLKEKLSTKKAKEAAEGVVDAYNKNFKEEISQEKVDEYFEDAEQYLTQSKLISDEKNVPAMLAGLKSLKKSKKEAQNEGDDEDVEYYDSLIDDVKDSLWQQVDLLNEYKTKLESVPENLLSDDQKKTLTSVNDDIAFIYKTLDKNKWKQITIDDIFSKNILSDVKQKLLDKVDLKNNTGISESDLKQFPLLVKAIKNAGVSAQDVVDEINSEAGIVDYDGIKQGLEKNFMTSVKDSSSIVKDSMKLAWKNFTKNFTDDDYKLMSDISQENNTVNWGITEWKDAIKTAKEASANLDDGIKTTLESVLSDTSDGSLSSIIDSYQSNISTLSDTLNTLKSDDFKESDLTDLIQQFPELADNTDNLQQSISNLKADQLNTVLKQIDDAMTDASDDEIAKANALKQALIDSTDFSDIDPTKISSQIIKTYSNNDEMEGAGSKAADLFSQAFEQELQTGLGRDTLFKVLQDEDTAMSSTDKIREKYLEKLPDASTLIKDQDFQTAIDKYQNDYSELLKVQEDLENNTFDPSVYSALFTEFPELATASMSELPVLVQSKMEDVTGVIQKVIGDAITTYKLAGKEEDANILQDYLDSIQESVDEFNISNIFTQVSKAQSDIEKLNEAFNSLKKGDYSDSDIATLTDQFSELIGVTGDFNDAVSKLAVNKFTKSMNKINKAIENETDASKRAILEQKKILLAQSTELPEVSDETFRDQFLSQISSKMGAKNGAEYAKGFYEKFADIIGNNYSRGILSKVVADTSVLAQGYDAVYQKYTSYVPDSETILKDTTLSSELSDYTEKYQELYAAQKQIKQGLMTGANRKTFLDKFPKLAKYASSTETLSSAVDDLMTSMDNNVLSQFQDKINALELAGKHQEASALKAYVQDVINGAHDIENAYAQISNMKFKTPDYERVKDAQDDTTSGAMYDDIMSLYETAKSNWQKGLTGTTAFKSFAALISPTGTEDAVNFGQNIAKFERYFQDSSQGCENFLEDLQALNLAEKDGEHWTTSIGNNLDEMRRAADLLGIGFEPFMSMFGKLEDYGATNDFFTTEAEGQEHISDLYDQLVDKKVKLAQIKANPDLAGNTSAIEAYEKEIAILEERIESTNVGIAEAPEKAAYYEKRNAEQAKKAVLDLQKDIDKAVADGDTQLVNKLTNARDSMLKEYGYVFGGINYDVQPQGSIDELATGRGFSSAESLHNYKEVVSTIQQANKEGNETLKNSLEILSQFTETDLGSIDLFDGILSEGDLGNAERALDALISEFGLSKEQALELVAVLSDMGQLKVEPEVNLQTVQQQIDETRNKLETTLSKAGIDIDLDFNVEEMSTEEIDAKIEELQSASAHLAEQGYTSAAAQIDALITTLSGTTYEMKIQAVVESDDGSYEELLELTSGEYTDELGKEIETKFGIEITGKDDLDKVNKDLKEAKENDGSEVSMTVQLDETQFNALINGNQKKDASITVKANTEEVKKAVDNAVSDIRKRKPEMKIDADNGPAINKGTSATQMINGMNASVKVDADISQMADTINNELLKPHKVNVVANVTTHIDGSVSRAPKNAAGSADGTAVRIAHADGTAYNVLNYRPAYADGNISLPNDELSLVNEENQESIVRNGRWMLIPGGAHFENLKKGDIIFNARQTSELIKSGRVTSGGGHGRTAYASGSVRDGLNAFADGTYIGTRWDKETTQAGVTANTAAQNANTSATNSNTGATDDNTKATKKSIKTFDWVAIRLKVWEQKVQAVADSITDFVSKTFKTRQLMRQMHLINGQISSNQKGAQTYMDKANSVANGYTYYTSDGGEIQVTIPEEYKKLVQLGEYKIEDMDTTTDQGKALAEAIDQYQSYYEKAKDCEQAVIDLQNQQMELFDQWTNMPTEIAEKRLERLNKGFTGLEATEARTSAAQAGRSTQAAMVRIARDGVKQATTPEAKKAMRKDAKRVTDAYKKGNELTYMNGMVDKNVKKKENEVKIRNNAYSKTVGNRVKYERIYKNNKKTVNSGSKIADQYSGILTDEQKNALKSGKKVDVSGVTNPQALAALNKYNKGVENLTRSQQKYNNTIDKEKEAAANAAQAQTELAQARVEAIQTKIDNTADYYDTRIAFKSAKAEGKEKKIDAYNVRNYARVSDYDVKIGNAKEQQKLTKKKAKDMQDALNAGVKSGAIKVGSKEWLEARTRIEEAKNAAADFDTEIENLQSQKIAAYYEKEFDRVIDKINQTKERLSTINGLISDDMKINKNTGQLTDMGAMSVMLTNQEFSANQEALVKNMEAQEQAKRDRQKNKDAGGKKGVGLTKKEYDERMSKLKSEQNTLLQNGMSLRQEQINLIISQAQAELDILNKTISKRKEALKAKKDYYDYDKTLKNKTKDIQTIERQIAALEGSTNAEDKARKARLQEQLASAKDSLQDTITDHSYTLQTDSLDQLSADLQEDFERWENDLRGSIDKMSQAISTALENAGLNNNKIRANLKNLLISVGVPADKVDSVLTVGAVTGSAPAGTTSTGNTSTSNKSKSSKSKKSSSKKSSTSKKSKSKSKKSSTSKKKTTKGYASGTNYVPKSDIYRVNEKGQEIINSKRYGLITYLEKGDSVYPANISEQILAGASAVTNSNLPDFSELAKGLENTVSNTDMGSNTYISNFYINGSEDPETLMKQIDKHINELIAKNDKKRVRDFKSLH